MNNIKQGIDNYEIPNYLEEILVNNYCPNFLRMTMIRENADYRFSYHTERFKKLDFESLNTYDKLVLLRSLVSINDRNEEWLIKAENYLLEPELIYSVNNCVKDGAVRLLFYPDYRKICFNKKLALFSDKIMNKRNKEELELLNSIKSLAEQDDMNRMGMFLDKNIMRMEKREQYDYS